MKKCGTCKIEKSVDLFSKSKAQKDGYVSKCKECQKEYKREWYKKNRETQLSKMKDYNTDNREVRLEQQKQYREDNKESIHQTKEIWRKNNQKRVTTNLNKNRKRRYDTDMMFRLKTHIGNRLKVYLKKNNLQKNNTTQNIIGCSPQELRDHLESQFTDGMSWNNYGFYGWHVDHIIPMASAKTEKELHKLNHYSNLQPLWAEDNIKKGDKILDNLI
tara:strand:- start:29 stop:679 length:651 start_codon:yes stop_codon:yes gene_type:complete